MLKRKQSLFRKPLHFFLIVFFTIFLFLLSSKLVIAYFLVYFAFVLIRSFSLVSKPFILSSTIGLIVFFAFVLIVPNPVSNRFQEIIGTDFDFLKSEKYNPGEYFNGLQFRMLQWRFVPQILTEKKAWLTGVSVGNAQSLLDQKYRSANMYVGDSRRGDKGFLGYNTHNEVLEALLQTGVPGLLIFILIIGSLIRMAWKRRNPELVFVTILLISYCFLESVLESQYSLVIFLFFPSFFYQKKV